MGHLGKRGLQGFAGSKVTRQSGRGVAYGSVRGGSLHHAVPWCDVVFLKSPIWQAAEFAVVTLVRPPREFGTKGQAPPGQDVMLGVFHAVDESALTFSLTHSGRC